MKLALNGWFYHQPHTGSGQYLRWLLHYLPDDVEVTLVVPQSNQQSEISNQKFRIINLQSSILRLRSGQVSDLGKVRFEQFDFPNACRDLKADLAHIPYWAPPLNSPVPFVVTIHDIMPLLLPEYNDSIKLRLYNALVSAASQGASHVIADSESSRQDILKHLRLPQEKVTSILLAASPEYFPRLGALVDIAARQKYNLPDSYVLYLGGFHPRKNVRGLLAAWTWASDSIGEQYPLVIAGALPKKTERFYDDFEEYAERLKIKDSVRFIGAVDEDDKAAIYRGAACFVFPSRYEGFGLPPLEAMACGTPVVTTAFSSIPEVVGDAAYLVEDPDNARSLGAAILSVIVNDDLSQRLINDGLAQAKKFSWQKTVEQTVAVYKTVVSHQ
jgi:glycosyltransferase involved in cell wall biosynthesis